MTHSSNAVNLMHSSFLGALQVQIIMYNSCRLALKVHQKNDGCMNLMRLAALLEQMTKLLSKLPESLIPFILFIFETLGQQMNGE